MQEDDHGDLQEEDQGGVLWLLSKVKQDPPKEVCHKNPPSDAFLLFKSTKSGKQEDFKPIEYFILDFVICKIFPEMNIRPVYYYIKRTIFQLLLLLLYNLVK